MARNPDIKHAPIDTLRDLLASSPMDSSWPRDGDLDLPDGKSPNGDWLASSFWQCVQDHCSPAFSSRPRPRQFRRCVRCIVFARKLLHRPLFLGSLTLKLAYPSATPFSTSFCFSFSLTLSFSLSLFSRRTRCLHVVDVSTDRTPLQSCHDLLSKFEENTGSFFSLFFSFFPRSSPSHKKAQLARQCRESGKKTRRLQSWSIALLVAGVIRRRDSSFRLLVDRVSSSWSWQRELSA